MQFIMFPIRISFLIFTCQFAFHLHLHIYISQLCFYSNNVINSISCRSFSFSIPTDRRTDHSPIIPVQRRDPNQIKMLKYGLLALAVICSTTNAGTHQKHRFNIIDTDRRTSRPTRRYERDRGTTHNSRFKVGSMN